MFRYFEIKGKSQTIKLEIEDGSPASTATVEQVSAFMKQDLREVDLKEYKKLNKEFSDRLEAR